MKMRPGLNVRSNLCYIRLSLCLLLPPPNLSLPCSLCLPIHPVLLSFCLSTFIACVVCVCIHRNVCMWIDRPNKDACCFSCPHYYCTPERKPSAAMSRLACPEPSSSTSMREQAGRKMLSSPFACPTTLPGGTRRIPTSLPGIHVSSAIIERTHEAGGESGGWQVLEASETHYKLSSRTGPAPQRSRCRCFTGTRPSSKLPTTSCHCPTSMRPTSCTRSACATGRARLLVLGKILLAVNPWRKVDIYGKSQLESFLSGKAQGRAAHFATAAGVPHDAVKLEEPMRPHQRRVGSWQDRGTKYVLRC